ncbi:ROK family protein [Streptomyces telluris]|uniref:ROK family protein n=1 Tax=Streptomyces telluris TaxID=2720021 RepID=A0A9X2RNX7_9ACTN|nr:ROK family protein [Streptomyces telluris]MCQ8770490.1 ROK family protein [Streptomyces telluris]NJP81945.1 ROK family protein [Streptomyces telluris]
MNANDGKVRQVLQRSHELDHEHYAVGVELQPYKLTGVVVGADGAVIARTRRHLTVMESAEVVQRVAEMAGRLMDDRLGCAFPRDRVCVGVQVGGPVDPDTGTVLHLVNGPDDHRHEKPPPYEWVDVPLGAELAFKMGCATSVENDAHAFAAYEQSLGVGSTSATFGVVLVRDGVGAGMVVRGERVFVPMEFGHLQVWQRGRICDCGMRGCIESQVGNRALTAVVKELTGRELDGLEAAIALADSTDPQARQAASAFRKAGTSIARGIATLLTTFGPTHVVIYAAEDLISGGPGRRAANSFLDAMRKFPAHTFHISRDCHIVTKPLDAVRGAHGAALIALQSCFGVRLRPR